MSWRQLATRSTCLRRGPFPLLARRRRLSTCRPSHAISLPQLDTCLHGFRVTHVRDIPEIAATAVTLSHKSGASYLHVARDDPNNVFGVGFRTPPRNSTGVAHILEHTVLCGSERFPTRDPFFKMLNRSLATFMNAFTASDWTMYPFSTCNETDYHNLMEVYLDAVFAPRLDQLDFQQEGWRLEHQDPNDRNSPIVFKGVVYNEMKGALADRHRYFAEKVQNALLHSQAYRHCSGGDPVSIPELSWQSLREFHMDHYSAANCFLFSYGDMPLEPHLELVHEGCLVSAVPYAAPPRIRPEPRWKRPRDQLLSCRPDPLAADPKRQNCVAVSYIQGDVTHAQQTLELQVLGSLLVDGPNAPFYRALIESGIGQDFAPHCTGFEAALRDTFFSVGVQGVSDEDKRRVSEVVSHTIDEVVDTGFDKHRVEATLHQLELSLRRQSTNFGLGLLMHVMAPWIHGAKPIDHLCFGDTIGELRRRLEDNPRLLQDACRNYLQNNRHRLLTMMEPCDKVESTAIAQEQSLLDSRLRGLHEFERDKLYNTGQKLLERQKTAASDNIECLPMLRLDDISDRLPRHEAQIRTVNNVPVHVLVQPTNDVCHFRALINVADVPVYLKPLLPLFCQLVTGMGTRHCDYRQLDQRVRLATGGLSAGLVVTDSPSEPGRFEEAVLLKSHCLQKHTATMMALWRELFVHVSFGDQERLVNMLQMAAAESSGSVTSSGHQYAMGEAAATISEAGRLRHIYSGLQQVRVLKSLVEEMRPELITTKMKLMAEMVLGRLSGARCALSCTESGVDEAVDGVSQLLDSVVTETISRTSSDFSVAPDFTATPMKQMVRLPLPVQFAATSLPTVPYTHADFAALRVLARCVSLSYLHPAIRERGGAYGSGALLSPGGVWHYYSYRDPSALSSLHTFDATADFVEKHSFDNGEITGSKLGVFQSVDAPVVPADRGMRLFLSGITDEQFEEHRRRLKAVSVEDLRRVANTYLRAPAVSGRCVLGALKEDDDLGKEWQVTDV